VKTDPSHRLRWLSRRRWNQAKSQRGFARSLGNTAVPAVVAICLLGGAIASHASRQTITEFPIPTTNSAPFGIAGGPDGALWFTEANSNQIGRITTAGVISEFPIPTAGSDPYGIAAGPDGALWFTEVGSNQIGRITTAGVITEFRIPTAGSAPMGIVAGPEGALWFAEHDASKIGRITTAGVITEFVIPTASSGPEGIVAGPDGALWFTEANSNQIGRITTAGVITNEFSIPTANSLPARIAAGPDGALWFTETNSNQIGRITTAGVITEFRIPTAGSAPMGIIAGLDGALWFTENNSNQVGRITTAGVISEFAISTAGSDPYGITAGPDGALWFTENSAKQIGRITPTITCPSFNDVPPNDPYFPFICAIAEAGITAGCSTSPPLYCPDSPVTRAQMAVFLLRAEHGSVYTPPACTGIFTDVTCTPGVGFSDWIEQLSIEGITAGCGGGNYCPDNPVTRAQMAVFLLRAEHGSSFLPPACAGIFQDVACTPTPAFAVDWIEQLVSEGITAGCGGGNYCPDNPVTRAQMAVFLVKAFALPTPTPTPTPTITQTPTITRTPTITPTPTPSVFMVSVGNNFFSPATVTVRVGDTVTWNWNSGGINHSTTSGACPPCTPDGHWNSGLKGSGTFSHTFTSGDAGTRPYYCTVHGAFMTGTVQVN